ncbi:unnamed protein product [Calicophoron daubneyi]|uniref:Galactose-1-phosphate uridylyltransferase n=1 Tax=Calicophoron daubneyi TaxID=300641 RepID=A0AAV2TLY7_CALDB
MSRIVGDSEPFVPKFPHRRYNPLLDQWIICSPQRITRPWTGQIEKTTSNTKSDRSETHPSPVNPLSPGATRSNGAVNPHYTGTYMFRNDFPALTQIVAEPALNASVPSDTESLSQDPLHAWTSARGDCQVMCFHPQFEKTLALMEHHEVLRVVDELCEMSKRYMDQKIYRWLQIFENRGAAVGCSNMHPHCQVWACEFLPSLAERRDFNQARYYKERGTPLLLEYARQEEKLIGKPNDRVVIHAKHWLVIVPWWACWPFETIIIPRRRHVRWLYELHSDERDNLADVMQDLLVRYDNLFETEFPYTMGWLQAPFPKSSVNCEMEDAATTYPHWQLHAEYQPPLLRSASVRKFMSGFEVFAESQRDLLPEKAAEMLRSAPSIHYTHRS